MSSHPSTPTSNQGNEGVSILSCKYLSNLSPPFHCLSFGVLMFCNIEAFLSFHYSNKKKKHINRWQLWSLGLLIKWTLNILCSPKPEETFPILLYCHVCQLPRLDLITLSLLAYFSELCLSVKEARALEVFTEFNAETEAVVLHPVL